MKPKIVFTCGCFDLIHAGHIAYLKEAKSMGNELIIGVTKDKFVNKLKGKKRPIIPEQDRVAIINALRCVDNAFLGNNPNFAKDIKLLKPDIYVKGGEYTLETINQDERKAVESYGGTILFAKYISGLSSSNIIEEIKEK